MSFSSAHKKASRLATKTNIQFSEEFKNKNSRATEKYIFGRNIYAEDVVKWVEVDGIIDDFTTDKTYLGYPIFKLSDISRDALVLNVAGGRPLSARSRLNEAGLRNLDYFAFYKLCGLPLTPVRFNEDFEKDFVANVDQYNWIYDHFADELSKSVFEKLVNFRNTYDLTYLEGFTQREEVQYFENFLNLQLAGETFCDVGSYNGFTTLEFAKRCPQYNSIHLFEPDSSNYRTCIDAVHSLPNVRCYPIGLSSKKATLKFDMRGSRSQISDSGSVTIAVDRLDNVLHERPTFIKIDIEGGELSAIEGAQETIGAHHPRLAIAAYHTAGDFWRIPRQILAIREDYDIYMRHYTECIYETVMFFVPRTQEKSQI